MNYPQGGQISSLEHFVVYEKYHIYKFLFQIICLTFSLLCLQVLFFGECHINFLHVEMLPSLLCQFSLFKICFPVNILHIFPIS